MAVDPASPGEAPAPSAPVGLTLDLSPSEVDTLLLYVARALDDLDSEIRRTDAHDLKVSLQRERDRLRAVLVRLDRNRR